MPTLKYSKSILVCLPWQDMAKNKIFLSHISEEEMAQALSRQLGYPYIDLSQFEVYPDVIDLIPVDIAKKNMIVTMRGLAI